MSIQRKLISAAIIVAFSAAGILHCKQIKGDSGPISNAAYVWQRSWDSPVVQAVNDYAPSFDHIVFLGAEITWKGATSSVDRPNVDYETLRRSGQHLGVALRIGPYRGAFTSESARLVTDVAASLVAQAKSQKLELSELQVDFDCAESKLGEYRVWLEAIGRRIAPTPVTLTVLPCWLNHPKFALLLKSVPEYVLQVHALQRPKTIHDDVVLCDPNQSKAWVEQAARLGVPFRVALPTYSYCVAFDEQGIFAGLSAEGPKLSWPENFTIKTLTADPVAMTVLLQAWSVSRPKMMRGIIWYRLPVGTDTLNWDWNTLHAVMSDEKPAAAFVVETRKAEPGLFEIDLFNNGNIRSDSNVNISVEWPENELLGGDAMNGSTWRQTGNASCEVLGIRAPNPGKRQIVAWLRLNQDKEVSVKCYPPSQR